MKDTTGKSLSIAMDNCEVQNKNNNAFHLVPQVVEMGWFRECDFIWCHKSLKWDGFANVISPDATSR
jgi:hypothetical protein